MLLLGLRKLAEENLGELGAVLDQVLENAFCEIDPQLVARLSASRSVLERRVSEDDIKFHVHT